MQKEEKKGSLLKRAGLNKETHLSVQDTIPYVEMARDGICKVSEGVYSKTVKFFDYVLTPVAGGIIVLQFKKNVKIFKERQIVKKIVIKILK